MEVADMNFDDAVRFHGHACPGLAIGYRVAQLFLRRLGNRAPDEESVAIVENNSCAVDAIQLLTGCTFGKGNLIFEDYGKQVYTFINRPSGEALRVAVKWARPQESEEEKSAWQRYSAGDRSSEVIDVVQSRKAKKLEAALATPEEELFTVTRLRLPLPHPARIFPSLTCGRCQESVMEPRARVRGGQIVCIPCADGHGQSLPAAKI